MCSAPKAPKVQDIPMRAMAVMPDAGDPSVRMSLRNKRALAPSAMILAGRNGAIGQPMTSANAATATL